MCTRAFRPSSENELATTRSRRRKFSVSVLFVISVRSYARGRPIDDFENFPKNLHTFIISDLYIYYRAIVLGCTFQTFL